MNDQVAPGWWFEFVVWGFEPLVLAEGKWEPLPDVQATTPNHQFQEAEMRLFLARMRSKSWFCASSNALSRCLGGMVKDDCGGLKFDIRREGLWRKAHWMRPRDREKVLNRQGVKQGHGPPHTIESIESLTIQSSMANSI